MRIGLVEANIEHGWAFRAHVPAIEFLRTVLGTDISISAVSTSRTESAHAAAAATGAEPFTSASALARFEAVDLVVVTVKVQAHSELVSAAQAAGKHVLCEWPLGLDAAEAHSMSVRATSQHRGFVGLQSRFDPSAIALREMIAAGELGDIQAVNARSSRAKGAETISAQSAYTLDRTSAAGTREVHTGHVLDLLDQVLGGIAVTGGTSRIHRRDYRVAGQALPVAATAPDTVRVQFDAGGALGSALIWDGDDNAQTVIDIQGSRGRASLFTLPVPTPIMRQVQMAPLAATFHPNGQPEPLTLPSSMPTIHLPGNPAATNIASQYLAIIDDLADGGSRTATFADAHRIHGYIEHISEEPGI
ncbi:unannotated protein [freshwater metagenome]|uniref:Unannotated protein n=1 Tax=freshwater metagenome TaxID=449393 RepID=A0A6J7EJ28_9ZZZZ